MASRSQSPVRWLLNALAAPLCPHFELQHGGQHAESHTHACMCSCRADLPCLVSMIKPCLRSCFAALQHMSQSHPSRSSTISSAWLGIAVLESCMQVDGLHNEKLQTVFLDDMPIKQASFACSGDKVGPEPCKPPCHMAGSWLCWVTGHTYLRHAVQYSSIQCTQL